jgi:hypothetical protein
VPDPTASQYFDGCCAVAHHASGGTLPFTGADVLTLFAVAAFAIAVGLCLYLSFPR